MGQEVRVAHGGEEGVELAEAMRPDLILLDLGMPRVDGYETCRRIRLKAWGNGPRIAAVTGWGEAQLERKTRDEGFDAHVVKPVTAATLFELLESCPN